MRANNWLILIALLSGLGWWYSPVSPRVPATAALAAEGQGKFWEFHDLLFKDYNQLNDGKIKEIVKKLDLNEQEFEKRMDDPQIVQKIKKDYIDGVNAGVSGTPTLFVNGKLLRNRSLDGFKEIIVKELGKARGK